MADWNVRRATLGADPEEDFLDKYRMMVKVLLAEDHNKKVYDKKTKKTEWEKIGTSWYRATIFGEADDLNSLPNLMMELKKGDMIRVIDGNMMQNSWKDKKTGEERFDWNFVINDFKQIYPKDYDDDK